MLPDNIQAELARLTQATAQNTGMILNIALSYGSRQEITAACQRLSAKVAAGTMRADEISEAAISRELYTHESPDPDLMIRTGGDQRISNFLLWQAAYAELYFTERCWPDFSLDDLHAAIKDFESRERRFGKVMHEPRA
jgi:undecaprenyl diphosphate synthase